MAASAIAAAAAARNVISSSAVQDPPSSASCKYAGHVPFSMLRLSSLCGRRATPSPHEFPGAIPFPRLRSRTFPISMSAASKTSHEVSSTDAAREGGSIWRSDVIPVWKRPYFLNRDWTGLDKGIALYMLLTHAACLIAPFYFTWAAFNVFLSLYFVTGLLGITLSFHRNLSHKSFTLPKWLEYTFAFCGTLAMQGDPLEWVSSHRYHHQHCDTEKDPHTPYAGFWHSHMGWLLDNSTVLEKVGARSNIGDMSKQPYYRFLQKASFIPGTLLLCGLYAWGGLPFLLWGGAVRLVWVYHITWLVNSASHVWGQQAWKTGDLSRNNWWVAILAFGEGWHNNHHAFEYSARHGLEWWQLDLTWYFILALEKLGLATNVKLPTKEHMKRLSLDTSLAS